MWEVEKITKFIVACCVVHNLCIDYDDNDECGDENVATENNNNPIDFTPRTVDVAPRARALRHLGELKDMNCVKAFHRK